MSCLGSLLRISTLGLGMSTLGLCFGSQLWIPILGIGLFYIGSQLWIPTLGIGLGMSTENLRFLFTTLG